MSGRTALAGAVAVVVAIALLWRRNRAPGCARHVRRTSTSVSSTTCSSKGCMTDPRPVSHPAGSSSYTPAHKPSQRGLRGHEWMGGAVGFAEHPGSTQRLYASARPPQNATLLLIGVVSGSKNFDVRNWLRRAFWRQRAWRLGVGWRFVVGSTLPRGDNDRVSLHYEAARHGDIDIVRGSELPPRQARKALRWWLHASVLASRADAPAFFALSYDSVLISLPRVALKLHLLRGRLDRREHAMPMDRRFIYGGDLRWAAWPEGASAGATWRCVSAVSSAALADARLAGDAGPPLDALTTAGRRQASINGSARLGDRLRPACVRRQGSHPLMFVAASPELQVLLPSRSQRGFFQFSRLPWNCSLASIAHDRMRLRPRIRTVRVVRVRADRLRSHQLEVHPPPDLWDRSKAYHQAAAGRTPSQPALLAATALARSVYNVSRSTSLAYLQLRASDAPPFSWEMEPHVVPGPNALLARGVTNGIIAEAVVERFERLERLSFTSGTNRLRCTRSRCHSWGMISPAHDALCCDEAGSEVLARVR